MAVRRTIWCALGLVALTGCEGSGAEAPPGAGSSAAPRESLLGSEDAGDFIAAPETPVGAALAPAAAPRPALEAPSAGEVPSAVETPSVAEAPSAVEAPEMAPAGAAAGGSPPGARDVDGPSVAATTIATTVYVMPNTDARRLGYIRLGGIVGRDADPVSGKGCKGQWYHVKPVGFVCTDEATIDMDHALVRAASRRPALDKPMPYSYGFVRATAPQYLVVPTREQQAKSEFKLDEHIEWFKEHEWDVQRPVLGANDVPLDSRGLPHPGMPLREGARLSTQVTQNELFGGTLDESIPWWLEDGRKIPNVSGFEVPEYAIFADRVRRKTGLSFVGAFMSESDGLERRFAVTVDMRLIPTTKVKPDSGALFHGVEMTRGLEMPLAFVSKRDATTWKLIKGRDVAKPDEGLPRRALLPLTGKARFKDGKRFYQLRRDPKRWVLADDVGVIAPPPEWPEPAEKGRKWIDISLVQQVLVLYVGKKPFYATLTSTGQDRLGDPETSKATPRGEFSIQSKHIAAAMDSEENSTVLGGQKTERKVRLSADVLATIERLKAAEKAGKKLNDQDQRRLLNIKKGRHPEYGVTMRRGSANYELRDVPWIQYFASGYAIHGAYWHDVFGIPRSHGCVNLSPIDARVVFMWTDPPVPEGWHGINVDKELGEGTPVIIRE